MNPPMTYFGQRRHTAGTTPSLSSQCGSHHSQFSWDDSGTAVLRGPMYNISVQNTSFGTHVHYVQWCVPPLAGSNAFFTTLPLLGNPTKINSLGTSWALKMPPKLSQVCSISSKDARLSPMAHRHGKIPVEYRNRA